jgi:hypothetical protein
MSESSDKTRRSRLKGVRDSPQTGELVDDTDGRKADETVSFGLDGQNFEIDLSARNAQSLRAALRPYTEAGRRFGPRRRTLHALPRSDERSS